MRSNWTAEPVGVALWWMIIQRQTLGRMAGTHSGGTSRAGLAAIGARIGGATGTPGVTSGAGAALRLPGPSKLGGGRLLTSWIGCSAWHPASAKTAAVTIAAHNLAILGLSRWVDKNDDNPVPGI